MVIQYTLTGMSRTPINSERAVIPEDDILLLSWFIRVGDIALAFNGRSQ